MKYPLVCVAVAAAGLAAGNAAAADLGGNCCADLEERIAELEATTARKGNRKVSLTVYGQVNEAVLIWDDGSENNAYVVTNDNSRTRFGFKGDAAIADGWKAGYVLEVGVRGGNSKRSNQDDPVGNPHNSLDVRHSRWFISSKSYGTISVGTTPTASEGSTETNLAHTKDIAKYSDVEDSGLGMHLRNTAGGLSSVQWRRLIRYTGDQPGETERRQGIWYQSPTLHGFSVEGGIGADDYWDVGLKYKGEEAGFKLAAAVAYGQNSDSQGNDQAFVECLSTSVAAQQNSGNSSQADCEHVGASLSVMHEDTGLYFNLAGGWFKDNNILGDTDIDGTNASDESTFWAIEAGIEQKFIDLGKTTFFGQYYQYDGGATNRVSVSAGSALDNGIAVPAGPGNVPPADNAEVFSSEVTMYGGGVVQELSKASMLLYAYYRHYEADLSLVNNDVVVKSAPLEDLDVGVVGAIIKF